MKKKLVLVMAVIFLVGIYSNMEAGWFFSKKKVEKKDTMRVKVNPNIPGWKQDKKPVTFDWYINFGWYKGKWGRDGATQAMTEATGVTAKYIMPVGDGGQKINTMIASNTLPDLITIGWWEPAYTDLVEAGLVYPLDVLAKKYDPYFFKVASPEKLGWYREKDGHTYGYPNASFTKADFEKNKKTMTSNSSFLVRKDIYEALGKPDMTTKKGFLDALKRAKEKYPEINGQPIIPLGLEEFGVGESSLGEYLADFLAIPLEKNGKAYDRRTDPELKSWLKTIRKANEMGLLSTDVFVDKRQQIEEKMVQGRYFAMLYPYQDAIQPLTNLYNNHPERMYISVPGPKDSNGDAPTLPGPGISGWTVTLITKNCKDPEKAIRFFDYMISKDGQRAAVLGKKGFSWDIIDGKEQPLPAVKKMMDKSREQYDQIHGGEYMNWMFMDTAMRNRFWPVPIEGPLAQARKFTMGKIQPRMIYERWDPVGQSPEAIINQKVTLKWTASLPKLVTAKSDEEFDKIWNKYISDEKRLDYNKVLNYRTKRMNENKRKLGSR